MKQQPTEAIQMSAHAVLHEHSRRNLLDLSMLSVIKMLTYPSDHSLKENHKQNVLSNDLQIHFLSTLTDIMSFY